jgi:hypothetical protein
LAMRAGAMPAGECNPALFTAVCALHYTLTTLAFAGEHGIQRAAVQRL